MDCELDKYVYDCEECGFCKGERKMNIENLRVILDKHKKWILNEEGGKRADLYGADLRGAILYGADLRGANLRGAILYGADLRRADLRGADLCGADLRGADFCRANLRRADFCRANLRRADLRGADLRGAILYGADLRGANVPDYVCPLNCPEEGSFIGFKKARSNKNEVIVKLRITETAKRSSATSRKCRCSEAEVLSIESLDGKSQFEKAISKYNATFVYEVGKIVRVEDFYENRWEECSTGIHFFITREEAVRY